MKKCMKKCANVYKNYIKWVNKGLKKLDAYDIGLIKIVMIAFTLILVKLIPGLLGIAWYWYLIIFVIAWIRPAKKFFLK